MRLVNQTITTGLKRKELPPVAYERIDENNVRIGTKWFKCHLRNQNTLRPQGVTIYHDPGTKQFISNSWYENEEIERL